MADQGPRALDSILLPGDNNRGLGSTVGRPRDPPVEGPDQNPEPSFVYVDGRSPLIGWDGPRRKQFNLLRVAAEEFGLVVQEHPADKDGDVPRRRHGHKRIDLEEAMDEIKWAPGILFDDWVKIYLAGATEGPTTLAAARAKASVALHRLYTVNQVEKRKDLRTGKMRLYAAGWAPPGKWAPAPAREGFLPPNAPQPPKPDYRNLSAREIFLFADGPSIDPGKRVDDLSEEERDAIMLSRRNALHKKIDDEASQK